MDTAAVSVELLSLAVQGELDRTRLELGPVAPESLAYVVGSRWTADGRRDTIPAHERAADPDLQNRSAKFSFEGLDLVHQNYRISARLRVRTRDGEQEVRMYDLLRTCSSRARRSRFWERVMSV